MFLKAIFAGIAVITLTGCEQEPATYEDCILMYMPGTSEKMATLLIDEACRTKFEGAATDKPSQ